MTAIKPTSLQPRDEEDPDGNHVELQVDAFGDWGASKTWMHTSPDFEQNPIGVFVDPAKIANEAAAGLPPPGDPPACDGR
jgi:hypothetical protein